MWWRLARVHWVEYDAAAASLRHIHMHTLSHAGFSSREVLMTVGRRTPTPVYDEESFVEEAEYSDDEDGEVRGVTYFVCIKVS